MFIDELESIEHEIDCDKKRELLIKLTVWYKRSEENNRRKTSFMNIHEKNSC